VLRVDGDEELDDLVGGQRVEHHGGDLDVGGAAVGHHLVHREQAVLPIEGPQDAALGRDLEHAEHAMAARRGELEPAIRHQEHRARHRGEVPRVGALYVVLDQLGDLLPITGRWYASGSPRCASRAAPTDRDGRGLPRLPFGAAAGGPPPSYESTSSARLVDVTRAQDRLVEGDAELLQPHRRNRDHATPPLTQASSSSSFRTREIHTPRSAMGAVATAVRAAATEAAMIEMQRAWQRRLSRCRRIRTTSANRTTSPTAVRPYHAGAEGGPPARPARGRR
jgi:hypothetical protein